MDFSDRICSGDGLGTKKGSGFYLKMVVQLILNLSVFPLFVFFFKEEIVLQLIFFSRFLNPPHLFLEIMVTKIYRMYVHHHTIMQIGKKLCNPITPELEGFR